MEKIIITAPAKINLTLDILYKREDGFHEIESVMMPINLCDVITIKKSPSNNITISSNNLSIPTGEENICYKVAKDFFTTVDISNQGINIDILNNIPNEAGLGGGSADGAATLIGLNRLFKTNLTEDQLIKIGNKSGSDIAFCIKGKTCLARGRGEILKEIDTSINFLILLIKPKINSSTKTAYDNFSKVEIQKRPKNEVVISALKNNNLQHLTKNLVNVFEEIIQIKEVTEIKTKLLESGALAASMTGSGTAVFGIFNEYSDLENARNDFVFDKNFEVFISKPYYEN